jgi:integrase
MAQIKKLADGKYLIRASKGTGPTRNYVNKTFRGTLKKAREHARELETKLDSGKLVQGDLTFEKYLDIWLAAIKPTVSPRTYDGYREYIERYAKASLAKFKLEDIRPLHVQQIFTSMKKSATTVRNLHAALRACFGYAVRKRQIDENPCKHADLPAKGRSREIVVLDEEEAAAFIEVCTEMPNGVIFMFALDTGMRPEEYLALRWRDIADGHASVQQAVQFNRKGGGYYFKELKTQRSRRRIPLTASVIAQLTRHRREQNEHRLAMKGTWFNYDLVFPNEVGRPFAINNITRRYLAPILEKMWPKPEDDETGPRTSASSLSTVHCPLSTAPKHVTLYSLRHSCATLLMMQGHNPKVVSERLGHASVNLTLDTYSHVLPTMQQDATDTMERIFRMVKK